jgi:flagellar basal-body rod modification protein FlgD
MTSSVTSSTNSAKTTDYSTSSTTATLSTQVLDQSDFLKLLTTQLSAQDPLNPTSDMDFTAQMAQFTTLEQTKSMVSSLSSLSSQQQFLQASGLIGRTVEVKIDSNTTAVGTVEGMVVEAGTPKLVINGRSFDLSSVLSVAATKQNSTNNSYALIS